MSIENIVIEGDSLTIIKKCKSRTPDLYILSAHIKNIKQNLDQFSRVLFYHVSRYANNLANAIANRVLKRREPIYLEKVVPYYAVRALESNWFRIPY